MLKSKALKLYFNEVLMSSQLLHLRPTKICIMKKLFITILFCTAFYSLSFAQTSSGTEFGVNVGYNSAYVTAGSGFNSAAISGFNAGASAEYYFSDRWSIKGKLIFDQKGWGNGFISDNNGNDINGVDFKLNYLTIPVMANWHFGHRRNWYLNFGPYAGILLSAKERQDNIDVKSEFNTADFGLDLGIGIKFPIGQNANLFIEADGQGGVTNIFKNSNGGTAENARSSLNFGFTFPLE